MSTKIRFTDVQDNEFASQSELDNITGGDNYIGNWLAESDTSGWSNSGANFTISRTTTAGEVLRGTGSFKATANGSQSIGDYISYPFTLNKGDMNRQLALRFYLHGISNFDSGDCVVVLHDGTNEIIPAITTLPGGDVYFETTWVSNTQTSWTLRFKAGVTSAFSFSFDAVFVGLKEIVKGAAIGPPNQYTPTIAGSTSDPTPGTISINRVTWWRSGKYMMFQYEFRQSTGGSNGTGSYLIPLPPGRTIDNDYTVFYGDLGGLTIIGNLGSSWLSDNSGFTYAMDVIAYDATHIAFFNTQSTGPQHWGSSHGSMGGNADLRMFATARIPITEWDADTVYSNSRNEYAYNTDETNADNTTDFAFGSEGALVPPVSGSLKYKDIEFANEPQSGELVDIWVKPKGRKWMPVGGTYMHWHEYSGAIRGIYMSPLSGNPKRYRVYFTSNGTGYSEEDNGTRTWSQENSSGTRWVVVKSSNPIAVETAAKEFYAATSSAKTISASADWLQFTGNSVTLPPGRWMLYGFIVCPASAYYQSLDGRWGSANGNDTGTTPAALTVEAGYNGTFNAGVSSDSFAGNHISSAVMVRLTAPSTTVYLNARVQYGGSAPGPVTTYIYAERIS